MRVHFGAAELQMFIIKVQKNNGLKYMMLTGQIAVLKIIMVAVEQD